MVTLVSVLMMGGFEPEFVLTRMIPGTALGVLVGDLVFTWMAFRLARRTGKQDATAMPLGLDTPSTFGISLLVLIPALSIGKDKYPQQAMEFAWHVGLVVLVLCGVFKTLLAPLGNAVRRLIPRAGLLGSLSAIAIVLIAFLPLVEGIAPVPPIGMIALVIILFTLVAHRELPGKIPGALAAVILGVGLYQFGLWLTRSQGWPLVPEPHKVQSAAPVDWSALAAIYQQSASWYADVFTTALAKLPVALPFALATIVGGIDCVESAAAAGDEYDTSAILLTEGLASLLAGLLGGVIQTTPYIGHPAFKKMGGRAAYTLANALFIGAVGCLGWFTYLFAWLPLAAMYPILVFVGLEIMAQSFHATPTKHYPALAIAMLPALAVLVNILLKQVYGVPPPDAEEARVKLQTLRCLANGFIITSLIWAAALAMILDGKLRAAGIYMLVAAICTFFGIIHSPLPDEQIGLPHVILGKLSSDVPALATAVRYQTPYHWTAAYAAVAGLLFALGARTGGPHPVTEEPEEPIPATPPLHQFGDEGESVTAIVKGK
jgi:AGZA family xanthine/uracil permease-like MFS transporter